MSGYNKNIDCESSSANTIMGVIIIILLLVLVCMSCAETFKNGIEPFSTLQKLVIPQYPKSNPSAPFATMNSCKEVIIVNGDISKDEIIKSLAKDVSIIEVKIDKNLIYNGQNTRMPLSKDMNKPIEHFPPPIKEGFTDPSVLQRRTAF